MVCIPIPGVPCIGPSLNPLSYVRDAINDSLKSLTTQFERVFVHPPVVTHGPAQEYLYGNEIGTAGKLAVTVAFIVTAIAIFYSKAAHRVLKSFIAVFVLAAATPAWFALSDGLISAGNSLASAALFYHPPPGSHTSASFLGSSVISDLVGAIFGGGLILGLGSVLIGVFYAYAEIILLVKFGMLFGIALYGLSQKLLNWLIAAGLVAIVFGRATAILVIEVSKVAADNGLYGNTVYGLTFYLVIGLLLALAAQYGLYKGLKNVVSQVAGRITSRVTGTVKSLTKRTSPSNRNAMAQQAHNASMPSRVVVVKPPMRKRIKSTARDQAITHGAKKLGASKAAAAAGPEAAIVAAALTMANRANKARKDNQARQRQTQP